MKEIMVYKLKQQNKMCTNLDKQDKIDIRICEFLFSFIVLSIDTVADEVVDLLIGIKHRYFSQ